MKRYRVYDVKINSQESPINLAYPIILNWKVLNGRQKRFTLQIATDESFSVIVTMIEKYSDLTQYRLSAGKLAYNQPYYYRVRSLNQDNELSPWSVTHHFEIPKTTWQAQWIRPHNPQKKNQPFQVGTQFTLSKHVTRAVLCATSLGLYSVSLNKKKVSTDYFRPGFTDYNHRLQYQRYDVTEVLQKDNDLTFIVADGWYSGNYGWDHAKDKFGNRTALLAQLEITYADGTQEILGTNSQWQLLACPIQSADIYQGEVINYHISPTVLGHPEEIAYPTTSLCLQQGPSVRNIAVLPIKKILRQSNGTAVIDFGQNMVGWLKIHVHGQFSPQVTVWHAEFLEHQVAFYTDNLRGAQATDHYTLSPETKILEPHFTYHGFRYAKISGLTKPLALTDVEGIVLSSDMPVTGTFRCDNDKLNRLQQNIEWSLKGNFFDIPTDCPQRDERLGWTGDAQIFGPTASYLRDTLGFYKKWLTDVALDQSDQNGAVPLVVPDTLKGMLSEGQMNTTTGWGDAATFLPWLLYRVYDDSSILATQYNSMKAWVNYMMGRGGNPYLWDTDIQLGDWLALDSPNQEADPVLGATDPALIATAFYSRSAQIVAMSAKVLGNMQDYAFYSDLHQKIVKAFHARFLDANGAVTSNTQTANALVLKFELVSGRAKQRAITNLVARIAQHHDHLVTGFLGTPYVCEVLADNGYQELAFKLLFNEDYPSWLYEVNHGGTTIWERWNAVQDDYTMNPDGMNSLNHYAYGAIGNFMYQYLGGIRSRKPGYKESLIYPLLPPADKVNAVMAQYNSVNGLIQNSWRRTGKQFTMDTTIPDNTNATIVLPTAAQKQEFLKTLKHRYAGITVGLADQITTTFMGEQYPLGPDFERSSITLGGDELILTVPGGTYHFEYQLQ